MLSTWQIASRPNLLTFPTQFDNVVWGKTALTVTADQSIAPDGTTTMEALIPTAVTGDHYSRRDTTGLQQINTTYTFSLYAKAGGYNFIDLRPLSITGAPRTVFNLQTGVIASQGSGITAARITPAPNGSYRCEVTYTTGATITPGNSLDVSVWSTSAAGGFTGDGTSKVYVWGAKLEVGAGATRFVG